MQTHISRLSLFSLAALLGAGACTTTDDEPDASREFTANLQVGVPATPNVTLLPTGTSAGPQLVSLPGDTAPTVVHPGENLNFAVGWQGGAITGINLSCTLGQYFSIPVPSAGAETEGVAQIPATLASGVCNALEDTCHDIQCFEQLASADGSLSVARAMQLVLDCGRTGCGETGSGSVPPGDPCATTTECIPGSVCFNRFCVGAGMLRISLAFSVDSDFDLHVLTPSGAEIYYSNREADAGTLDVDQCVDVCGTDAHVENVVFDGDVLGGRYEVWVVNFDGRSAGDFSVQVAGDAAQTFTGSLPATSRARSDSFTFDL